MKIMKVILDSHDSIIFNIKKNQIIIIRSYHRLLFKDCVSNKELGSLYFRVPLCFSKNPLLFQIKIKSFIYAFIKIFIVNCTLIYIKVFIYRFMSMKLLMCHIVESFVMKCLQLTSFISFIKQE